MKRPIPDTVANRRSHLGIDESFCNIARDDSVIPKIAAHFWGGPERMKRVNIFERPGPKHEALGTNSPRRPLSLQKSATDLSLTMWKPGQSLPKLAWSMGARGQ